MSTLSISLLMLRFSSLLRTANLFFSGRSLPFNTDSEKRLFSRLVFFYEFRILIVECIDSSLAAFRLLVVFLKQSRLRFTRG